VSAQEPEIIRKVACFGYQTSFSDKKRGVTGDFAIKVDSNHARRPALSLNLKLFYYQVYLSIMHVIWKQIIVNKESFRILIVMV
jgi:hypothetical protein